MLRFSISFLLLVAIPISAIGQNSERDSLQQETNTVDSLQVKEKKSLLGLSASIDYLKLHTIALQGSEKYEVSLSIIFFEDISAIAEYGVALINSETQFNNGVYRNTGNYYRVGVDYRFSINPGNFIYLGGRFSQASFNEEIEYSSNNPVFGIYEDKISRNNLSASWLEFVLTSETQIKRLFEKELGDFLFTGFRFRTKYILERESFSTIPAQTIAGFGTASNKFNIEFNLYLKFRLIF